MILKVPDMSCQHCKMRIEKSLSNLKNIQNLKVDLERKSVEIEGNISVEEVKNAIVASGYTPELPTDAEK
jgi:copper chaperone CopZ